MPANLKDLRSRIKSVRNTEQITKAMKLVSTAKLGKAQLAVNQSRPYARALVQMVRDVVGAMKADISHPLLTSPQSEVVTVVVISSDRGLCGSYNSNNAKLAVRTIDEVIASGKKVSVLCIGKKAYQILSRQLKEKNFISMSNTLAEIEQKPSLAGEINTLRLITTPFDKRISAYANALAQTLENMFKDSIVSKVLFVFTKFESVGNLPLTCDTILPLIAPTAQKNDIVEPLFEPSAELLLGVMLPKYLSMAVQQVLLEAVASEHCARMAAMESSSRNAKEMLRKLQITYQRARQASITRELIEIISGAEAL